MPPPGPPDTPAEERYPTRRVVSQPLSPGLSAPAALLSAMPFQLVPRHGIELRHLAKLLR